MHLRALRRDYCARRPPSKAPVNKTAKKICSEGLSEPELPLTSAEAHGRRLHRCTPDTVWRHRYAITSWHKMKCRRQMRCTWCWLVTAVRLTLVLDVLTLKKVIRDICNSTLHKWSMSIIETLRWHNFIFHLYSDEIIPIKPISWY